MTRSRYMIARIAQAFGLQRRQRRLSEAATESHLLREAEQVLGESIWQQVESIEQLGIEYWNLRRLTTKRDKLTEELVAAEATLQEAHDQRAAVLGAKSAVQEELVERQTALAEELDQLARKRDTVVERARHLRRLYDGLKTKLEVLESEQKSDEVTLEKSKTRMDELRAQFADLKNERDEIASRIETLNEQLDDIGSKLETERQQHRSEAGEAFQTIGDANRIISGHKAELGIIETEMQQLYGSIGRHVSLHLRHDANCREATRDFRSMVDVMLALRKSITYNHRLSGGSA